MEDGVFLFFLFLILGVITYRTFTFKKAGPEPERHPLAEVNRERAFENLASAVRFKTISGKNPDEFNKFFRFLETAYPRVHAELQREVINDFSLLYHWKGEDPKAKPVLLMGHSDVVPVEGETEDEWSYPPFGGTRAEGYIWGRGSMDNKNNIIGQLEAVEELLKSSFKPSRDVYLAFGHDEEIRGREGAYSIGRELEKRGIELSFVLDEGGGVMEGVIKGLSTPVALVGTGEKGFVNLRLTARSGGGHSATPPRVTGLGRLARAVVSLEKNQMQARITRPVREMLNHIGPEMPLGQRMLIANLWLFQPLFIHLFSSFPGGNAMLRTTVAPTMAEGSRASNVLPDSPSVTLNFRLLPGDSSEKLLEHVKKTVADEEIDIEVLNAYEPSSISSGASPEFNFLKERIKGVFPETTVTPYLVFGGTDARHYEPICQEIFRFSPMAIDNNELKRVHARDERLSESNMEKAVVFYSNLISKI